MAQITGFDALSLDVFDTVLTRACGTPGALYLWLGNRLSKREVISCTPEIFARARARAEQQVWDRAGGMDSHIFLADFYREVVRVLWMGAHLVDSLVEAELALEEEVLRVIPQTMRMIDQARRAGRRVVFISDTYFPGSFVENQLRKHGIWTPESACFASSDYARSKASGRLFEVVRDRLGLPSGAIIHGGDNPHSDVRVPRYKKLRSVWLPEGRLNRYEKLLSESMWANGGAGAALAGASRLARLHTGAEGPHQRAIREVAAGVAAPILVGYVLWILNRARDLGLSRLYFLARDGQVFAEIARALIDRLKWPINVSYLYVSRLSTNLAATFEANDEELGWVFRDLSFLSPKSFLARFDISWEEVAVEMKRIKIRPDDTTITPGNAKALKTLLGTGPLHRLLLERASVRRAIVTKYLEQEGLLNGMPCGLVDFGGVGSQMRALHSLLVNAGNPSPRLFLMGLDSIEGQYKGLLSTSGTPTWLADTECYLYDHRRELGIKRSRGFGTCVQMFCAADHGKVMGYRQEGERILPILSVDVDRTVIDWGLPVLRETIRQFVKHLVLDSDLVDLKADLREVSCRVIDKFWSDPSVEEARAWGAFLFEGAQASGGSPKPLAGAYSWPSVLGGVIHQSFPDLGWQHWHEGSLRLSPPLLRTAVGAAEKWYWAARRSPNPLAQRADRMIRRLLGRTSL